MLVSYFFEYTKKKEYLAAGEPPFTGTIDDFVHHRIGGLRSIVRFYNIWAENVAVPREFHLLTYEDLQADTRGELTRVLKLLDNSGIDPQCVDKAVSFGAFDNMRPRGTQRARAHPQSARQAGRYPGLQGPQGKGRRIR